MILFERGNDALNVNPITGVDEALSLHGSDWLWAVMAIYCLSLIVLLSFSFTSKESERVFHYLFTLVLLVGATTYFAQASDLGWSAVKQVDHVGNGLVRQMFWAKYVNWVVAFPSLALALGLVSGVSWTTIVTNIVCAWFWVITYLVAAYTTTSYKWGFFAFGTFAWLILAMSTINESREAAALLAVDRDYLILSVWLNVLWVLYPIAFGLTDGGNIIGVTSGHVFFGVLDVLMVPGLSFGFLFFSRNWDFRKLNIAFSDSRPSRENNPAYKEAPQTSPGDP
ncbi:family A G protein-coupled receptor-like protein [Xylona heveae TC161]|uniref:Family A G protein-coupled receptor-like protein n=1 Tax=Xylona heveae (strain CBS 132557 / TC161) TaxID=1328760 RepID=A0A165FKQ2_XYLHT|nr:family A G protein-coupled receptor-like protein [Xylona heveae TC161]KZF21088.1 family A G protein-coupled receptor-like protein [Xylona heveae TC161]